ncbi:MAG: GNAT family N-acetyltransferase, partial [bacterium]
IKPEDEPIWMEMLASCSKESIYARFQSLYTGWKYHKEAIRYCYIDYDREIAIVAELKDNDKRRLIGVGRLIADPDVLTAEYAVLIADPWQNQGLGKILTDYCLEISRDWGIKEVVAQTSTTNHRMVDIFRQLDFEVTIDHTNSEVYVKKIL